MLEFLPRLPGYVAFRRFGWPRLLPLNLVVSVTYRCNSRCQTCNVWQRDADELSLKEWRRVFRKMGRAPYYITFSGGEPFLRQDLIELVKSAYENCQPAVITIPTNGLLSRIIPSWVEGILEVTPQAQVIVNLSLDGVGQEHDAIRGVLGNYQRALETWEGLRAINHPNLVRGIHTVISRFNAARIPAIYQRLQELVPDSYITEIAEERVELGTVGMDIAPTLEEYSRAADYLIAQISQRRFSGLARITQAFRAQYYDLVKRILREERQVIPCYAGWASGHIAPDGDVWTCCTRAQPIGNLREVDYDLSKIWFGQRAAELRASIRRGECFCPMANASYSNMLLHLPTLARVAMRLAI